MSINVNFNGQSGQYIIEKDGEEIHSFPDAYIQSNGGNITAPQIHDAAKEVFEASDNTQWDVIENHNRRTQALYSKLGMFDNAPEA